MSVDPALVALLGASAGHAGFQLTVTTLVYPALARVDGAAWCEVHDRHSRGIVPLVVLTYAAVLAGCGWALVATPGAWVVAACVAQAVALGTTATLAAPLHGRLVEHDRALVERLLRVDRVRAAAALVGLVLAVGALSASA